jgi:cytochrome P450
MVNMNAFSPIAFEEFVKYIEKNPWKSEEEFCESQGKYIFMLYRKISPKTPLGVIYKLRGEAVDELRKESKRFKSDVERADRAAKEIAAGYDVSRREEFAAALAKYKALLLEERDQVVMDDSVEGIIAALQPQGSESPMPDAECDIKVIAAEDLLG